MGRRKFSTKAAEGDMTPMIDMVFQLIAFFMVLINFSQDDQNAKITLPTSELAKPSEGPAEFPIVMHLDKDGTIYMGANTASVDSIRPLLSTEIAVLISQEKSAADGNIIIRAHKDAPGGKVQDLINKCQDLGFEKFALRVKEEESR
ncbi:MAG: biopolymer transporter ExbD [Planctomycetota bacterium]|nr:biopolymer transporter ExbD [Planctomycetota bacterium]